MYCESLLYVSTPNVADVPANGIVPLSQTVRRVSQRITLGSDAINIVAPGYYKVSGTVTFFGSAAGDASFYVAKGGQPVVGIAATETVANDTDYHTVALEGIVRVFPNESAVLTLVNSGIAITASNVSLSVERVA